MVFFRKSKKADEAAESLRSRAATIANQDKWDALERLVNAETAPPSTPNVDNAQPPVSASSQNLDILAQDLRTTASETFASDLKVDMHADAEFVDVTPTSPDIDQKPSISAMVPSEHFHTDAPSTPIAGSDNHGLAEEAADNFIAPPPATDRPDRADLGTMRLDVARISADIQSGEELYRRAQQRIENLTNFVERAEIDFSMLNRLEPENRRLKARNRTVQREIDDNLQKMNVMRADLEDREQRLAEKSRAYDAALGKLASAQLSVQEYERALNDTRESSDRNALKSERLQTSLDVERRENEVLRTRLTDTVNEMEVKKTAYIEAKKIADSLAQDCADFRHQAQSAEKEADALRKTLITAQTQNNAMRAEMLSLHGDIRTFKTQSDFTIVSREDELSELQQQVHQLTKQLKIKDEIVQNAARDVQELRKVRAAQELERERLEVQIDAQSFQLEQANSELQQSKQDISDFDRRYRDVATALSVAQSRRMSNAPAETPDIQPIPAAKAPPSTPPLRENIPQAKTPAPQPKKPAPKATPPKDEVEALSSEEIQERIMDFRLGLRSDIT